MKEVIPIDKICDMTSAEFNPELNKLENFIGKEIEVLKIERVDSIVHKDENRKTVKFSFSTSDDEIHTVTTSAKFLVNQLLQILDVIPDIGEETCDKSVKGKLDADHVLGKYRNIHLTSVG